MKRYTIPAGRQSEVTHEHPERTARRSIGTLGETVEFQVWPSRKAMQESIRMQSRGVTRNPWRALPLSKTCVCGKAFTVREFDTDFCSDECWRGSKTAALPNTQVGE